MEMNRFLKIIVNSRLWNFFLTQFFLVNILNLVEREPKTILEIGCGAGFTAEKLLKYFPDAEWLAIDYDSEQILKAKKRLGHIKNINVQQADATKLPFASDKFDAVFMFNTLHHIANFPEALKEISRVLKSQGLLYLMDETKDFWNILFKWIDKPEALFSQRDIINAALKYKLECQKFQGRKFFYSIFKKLEV